jgi:hypothetical protein
MVSADTNGYTADSPLLGISTPAVQLMLVLFIADLPLSTKELFHQINCRIRKLS